MIKSEDERKIFTAVIVMITLAMLALGILDGPTSSQPGSSGLKNRADGEDSIVYAATRIEAPSNVSVPNVNSQVPEGVARPTEVVPAGPKSKAHYRSFNIQIVNNRFVPDTVIANENDTVHMNLSAIDGDYDFLQPDYGSRQLIPQGVTKVVEFQAHQNGKFTFYCTRCGGPDQGPRGYLIVAPRT